eukprot:9493222-Pyramimonas_sp.AAC.1
MVMRMRMRMMLMMMLMLMMAMIDAATWTDHVDAVSCSDGSDHGGCDADEVDDDGIAMVMVAIALAIPAMSEGGRMFWLDATAPTPTVWGPRWLLPTVWGLRWLLPTGWGPRWLLRRTLCDYLLTKSWQPVRGNLMMMMR